MSLRKRCSPYERPTLKDGVANPRHCSTSPICDHVWQYEIRVNGWRYRASTETADKHQARDVEAREHARLVVEKGGVR